MPHRPKAAPASVDRARPNYRGEPLDRHISGRLDNFRATACRTIHDIRAAINEADWPAIISRASRLSEDATAMGAEKLALLASYVRSRAMVSQANGKQCTEIFHAFVALDACTEQTLRQLDGQISPVVADERKRRYRRDIPVTIRHLIE